MISNSQLNSKIVLLWDTDANGVVSLSAGPYWEKLRSKTRAAHFSGGTVLVRPAELLEGDHVYESAIRPSGDLYNLMLEKRAMLLLGEGETFADRIRWKFGENRGVFKKKIVFHQGNEIKKGTREYWRIWDECWRRHDEIMSLHWRDRILHHSQDVLYRRSEAYYRILERSYREFEPYRVRKSELASFLRTNRKNLIASRSDLYKRIDKSWSRDYDAAHRRLFQNQTKQDMTDATAVTMAQDVDSTMSQLSTSTVERWGHGSLEGHSIQFANATLRATYALSCAIQREYAKKHKDMVGSQSILSAPVTEFMRASDEIVHKDRKDLRCLLFKRSAIEQLEGLSLSEYAYKYRDTSVRVLNRLAAERFEEYQSSVNKRCDRVFNIIHSGWTLASGVVSLYSPLYAAVSTAGQVLAMSLKRHLPGFLKGFRPILMCMTRRLSPK